MAKDLAQVEILLNPDVKYWSLIMQQIADTLDWPFAIEDYAICLDGFEKFWFFAAVDGETDEPIGSVTVSYERSDSKKEDEDCYCIGMYYVREEWRHTGVGSALFNKVMEIGKDSNMALLGVLAMSQKYATKYGFSKMLNYTYVLANIPTEHLIIPEPDPRYILKDLRDIDEVQLVAYDASVCHRSRAKFLQTFITSKGFHFKVALDQTGKIVGFCNIRPALANFLSVSPLYADNEAVARTLLSGVLPMIEDIKKYRFIEMLYPDVNKEAQRLCDLIGGGHTKTHPDLQCAFTKKVLVIDESKVFAILGGTNNFV